MKRYINKRIDKWTNEWITECIDKLSNGFRYGYINELIVNNIIINMWKDG